MDIEVFQNELHTRFIHNAKVVVDTTTNIPGQPMPRYENIWMIEVEPSEVNCHISNLQSVSPLVVFDIKDELSMNYPLGTFTTDVMQKANSHYASKPQVLSLIKEYADYIYEAYQISWAYDKACAKFAQFQNVRPVDSLLLQQAWQAIQSVNYTNGKSSMLSNAIQTAANNNNIAL